MRSASRLVPLCAGLALGSAATWTLLNLHSPPSASTAALPLPGSSLPAAFPTPPPPPPRLAGHEATTALDAYLALPPLPDKAPAAELVARTGELRVLLTRLPVSLFERLLSALASRAGSAEARLRAVAFTAWAEYAAPAAARWALSLSTSKALDAKTRANYLQNAAKIWAETDFDSAYAWVNELADPALATELAGQLLATLIATDPARTLALAHARGDAFYAAHRETLCKAWTKIDPGAAVRTFISEFYDQPNDEIIRSSVSAWLKREPAAALDWIMSLQDKHLDTYRGFMPFILERSARYNSSAARALADLLASRPEPRADLSDRQNTLARIVNAWSNGDPKDALAWLQNRPLDEARTQMVESALNTLVYRHSPEFLAALHLLPAGESRNKYLVDYVTELANSDPASALDWLAANPSAEVTAVAPLVQGTIIADLAQADPARALRLLSTEIETHAADGPERGQLPLVVQKVATQLALKDPDGLTQWASTLAQPDLRLSAYFALAGLPAEFLGKFQPVPLAQAGSWALSNRIAGLGFGVSGGSLARRADLLATIPEVALRTEPLLYLLSNWLESDYDTARAWIEDHDAVSPESAARLLDAKDPLNIGRF
jgi:hypothetical protein